MKRRTFLAAGALLAPLASAGGAEPTAKIHDGPTVDQLICLAKNGRDPETKRYYGELLGACLLATGAVARDNGDGTITLYLPRVGGYVDRVIRTSVRPIPPELLTHIKPANRGEGFPAGVGYTELP